MKIKAIISMLKKTVGTYLEQKEATDNLSIP